MNVADGRRSSAGARGVGLTRQQALWLVPSALAIHNAEEALTFPTYWPIVRGRLPDVIRPITADFHAADFRSALVWATLVPIAIVGWAALRPDSSIARWAALVVQAVMAVNVVSHVAVAALFMHGYSPGIITAVLVNAPLSFYLFRRAAREHWISQAAWRGVVPAALFIHGPALIGLLILSRR